MSEEQHIKKHKNKIVILLAAALAAFALFSVTQGSVKIPLRDVAKIVFSALGGDALADIKPTHAFIVLQVRLPRIFLAAMVGGVLAVIGAAFQAIFRNPMADPYVMGVSSGAAFGATIGTILGWSASFIGFSGISILAFAGALSTVAIVYQLARVGTRVSATGILLAGIVMNALLSSAISLMMLLNHSKIDKIVTWTMGSFNASSWDHVKWIAIPALLGSLMLLSDARAFNALVMGEEDAQGMGVDVNKLKRRTLIVASFLAAFTVSVSGIIGFVGLVVPHLLRMMIGSDHRRLLPVSFLGGALLLLVCDTMARSLIENMEIPVGIITALIGGPFFLMLLQRHKRELP
ncbi:MAG: cobalamin transport system permease protein [Clostridiales bacterium]|nr:cobalamin transport system permease protein [Clostridiales bacterium]